MRFATRADAPARVTSAEGIAADVRLSSARPGSVAEAADGYLVYRDATDRGGALLRQVIPGGFEDFALFWEKPEREELSYDVSIGEGVAGLRLVENVLELLDAGGAPRLRVTAPYTLGADGKRVSMATRVEGCAVDTNPAMPFGRAVTSPGANVCRVHFAWSGVQYPALVDPSWTGTGNMSTEREWHRSSLVLDTKHVLVSGGFDGFGNPLNSAEIYDAMAGAWTVTGSMSEKRAIHRQALLPSGRVLAVGGWPYTNMDSEEYDAIKGGWTSLSKMKMAHVGHTLTAAGGKYYACGGYASPVDITARCELYDPVTLSWSVSYSMFNPRAFHASVELNNDVFILTGGDVTPTPADPPTTPITAQDTSELYQASSGIKWLGASMLSKRTHHTANLLVGANPQAFVTGGTDGSSVWDTTEAYYNPVPIPSNAGGFKPGPNMSEPRMDHTAVLTDGAFDVLVAGGRIGIPGPATRSTEMWSAFTFGWTPEPDMNEMRFAHISEFVPGAPSINLPTGAVLVSGGDDSSNTLSSAELF